MNKWDSIFWSCLVLSAGAIFCMIFYAMSTQVDSSGALYRCINHSEDVEVSIQCTKIIYGDQNDE